MDHISLNAFVVLMMNAFQRIAIHQMFVNKNAKIGDVIVKVIMNAIAIVAIKMNVFGLILHSFIVLFSLMSK